MARIKGPKKTNRYPDDFKIKAKTLPLKSTVRQALIILGSPLFITISKYIKDPEGGDWVDGKND